MPFSFLKEKGEKEREVKYTMGNEKKSNQNGKVLCNSCVIKEKS